MEDKRLQDRIAIVTGSDSGIGQAVAIAFAEEGADVVVTYFRDEEGGHDTCREIKSRGRRALLRSLDQRDPINVARLFDDTRRQLGQPTILVNNAGINASGTRIEKMTID